MIAESIDKRPKSPEWHSPGKRLGFRELGRMARSVLVAVRDWSTGRRVEDAASSTHGAYAEAAAETMTASGQRSGEYERLRWGWQSRTRLADVKWDEKA